MFDVVRFEFTQFVSVTNTTETYAHAHTHKDKANRRDGGETAELNRGTWLNESTGLDFPRSAKC